MTLYPAIFLDRDNTLIENAGYLGDPSGVKLLPGTASALAAFREMGFRLVVVSNQAGVARGYYDEAAVDAVNREICRQLAGEHSGAIIDASYYCPFHPDALLEKYRQAHSWRKPSPGMLQQAAVDLSLDLSKSWMIGDQLRDVAAGRTAGCRTILLKNPNLMPAQDQADLDRYRPDYEIQHLPEAIPIIMSSSRS